MRIKAFLCALALVAPLCASAQRSGVPHMGGVHLPRLGGGRGSGTSRRGQRKAPTDPYSYGAVPLPPAEGRSTSGLINPYFTRPPLDRVEGAPAGELVLPNLALSPIGLEPIASEDLTRPGTPQAESEPDEEDHPYGLPPLPEAPLVVSEMIKAGYIQTSMRVIIAPTILGLTEDFEPSAYGKDVEGAPATGAPPGLQPLGLASIGLQDARINKLGLHELAFGSEDLSEPNFNYRLPSRIMTTRIIPWKAKANMPQTPVEEGPAFRLPRAIASLTNVNFNFGLGIPNFIPNIHSLTAGYLGLSDIANYLSPEVADRLYNPYGNQSP